MQPFAFQRLARYNGYGPRPQTPTLNTGHMAYFLPFGPWLEAHWLSLREEMRRRGFKPTLTWRPYPFQEPMPSSHMDLGRPLLQARILQRLSTMKTVTWTSTTPPLWVLRACA